MNPTFLSIAILNDRRLKVNVAKTQAISVGSNLLPGPPRLLGEAIDYTMGYRIFVFLVTRYDAENGHQSSVNKDITDDGGDTEVCRTGSMYYLENNKEFKSPTTSLSTFLYLYYYGSILDTPRKVHRKSELHKLLR
ncbi:uncharacterized protein LOC114242786 [Bombyx mandarina]|uniref:Uncharacterized protein LOC114242786 n=1 Tax=Bombyx mandarina TaxID=7092 RepID=A0A6J2JJV4_BOMMA|nr:uncharacterized protein LOC114242786 [Bombyx mandarina]